jgi:hypothetical protein
VLTSSSHSQGRIDQGGATAGLLVSKLFCKRPGTAGPICALPSRDKLAAIKTMKTTAIMGVDFMRVESSRICAIFVAVLLEPCGNAGGHGWRAC